MTCTKLVESWAIKRIFGVQVPRTDTLSYLTRNGINFGSSLIYSLKYLVGQ